MSKPKPHIVYIAGPETSTDQARAAAQQQGLKPPVLLKRRGTVLGWVAEHSEQNNIDIKAAAQAWHSASAYSMPAFVSTELPAQQANIKQALGLMEAIAEGTEVAELFEHSPYIERTTPQFEMLASFQDEGDAQEIETIEYDAVDGNDVVAENLWCKASWLSFEDDDASLRFRFSFGMAGYEDVAVDLNRQRYAAQLTDAIFPESAVISNNTKLYSFMQQVLNTEKLTYVERIIYFNAPNGGAQFHQDVERGHLGVVFAQLHGSTCWAACSKAQLINEIQTFVSDTANNEALDRLMDKSMLTALKQKSLNRQQLNNCLDNRDNDPLELLINRCPDFYRHLFEKGYGYIINPGDIILLPQKNIDECCWHSVFCIDDFPGESLSFAIRAVD